MFYKLPRKNNQSIVVFLSGIDFLGYQLQLQQGLVISGNTHARDVPLRSCVPVFHLLSYLNPIICIFFSAKEPESCVSCPLHRLAQPPLLFLSLPSQTGTQLLTLPSRSVFLLHLFGLALECRPRSA